MAASKGGAAAPAKKVKGGTATPAAPAAPAPAKGGNATPSNGVGGMRAPAPGNGYGGMQAPTTTYNHTAPDGTPGQVQVGPGGEQFQPTTGTPTKGGRAAPVDPYGGVTDQVANAGSGFHPGAAPPPVNAKGGTAVQKPGMPEAQANLPVDAQAQASSLHHLRNDITGPVTHYGSEEQAAGVNAEGQPGYWHIRGDGSRVFMRGVNEATHHADATGFNTTAPNTAAFHSVAGPTGVGSKGGAATPAAPPAAASTPAAAPAPTGVSAANAKGGTATPGAAPATTAKGGHATPVDTNYHADRPNGPGYVSQAGPTGVGSKGGTAEPGTGGTVASGQGPADNSGQSDLGTMQDATLSDQQANSQHLIDEAQAAGSSDQAKAAADRDLKLAGLDQQQADAVEQATELANRQGLLYSGTLGDRLGKLAANYAQQKGAIDEGGQSASDSVIQHILETLAGQGVQGIGDVTDAAGRASAGDVTAADAGALAAPRATPKPKIVKAKPKPKTNHGRPAGRHTGGARAPAKPKHRRH